MGKPGKQYFWLCSLSRMSLSSPGGVGWPPPQSLASTALRGTLAEFTGYVEWAWRLVLSVSLTKIQTHQHRP